MISKSDVVLLLNDLKSKGIDVTEDVKLVYASTSIPMQVLKKINDNRPLDLLTFYERVRKSYNNKKSKMYINIMKSDENLISDPNTVLTTLSALLNQIYLFKCDDVLMFYEHSRVQEILGVLNIYYKTQDIEPAFKLLRLIKADIKCLQALR